MENPFLKRATERLREDDAFLAVVSPEPLRYYFGETQADHQTLFDRLAIMIGQPGSGKTTIARLLEYSTLTALLHRRNVPEFRELAKTLADCQVIKDDRPLVLGCRIPMEADYRDFWELPYPSNLKGQLFWSMVQCRTVLSWFRQLESAQVDLGNVNIVAKSGAGLDSIGGITAGGLRDKARKVESALYSIASSILAPNLSQLPDEAVGAYKPFDVIESFAVPYFDGTILTLQPLVMFDDAHQLHDEQYSLLTSLLLRRELRIARWVLSRLDAVGFNDILKTASSDGGEAVVPRRFTVNRDVTEVIFQTRSTKQGERRYFRTMARDMARRYLSRMSLFRNAGLRELGTLLSSQPTGLTAADLKKLAKSVESIQEQFKIPARQIENAQQLVSEYLKSSQREQEKDVALAMLSILIYRFTNRVPQTLLFEEFNDDIEPSKPLTADSTVYDGARLHLHHQYGRPFFHGFDMVCDAAGENPEQFLWLAAELVEHLSIRLQRKQKPELTAKQQHDILQSRAAKAVSDWDFPHSPQVKRLVDEIADKCKRKSMEPNAPLGAGACAYGFPQEEFDRLLKTNHEVMRILKFGVAYNALTIVQNYPCKKRSWCLLELGGFILLKQGLTLKRGGFVEGTSSELIRMVTSSRE